MILIDHQPGAVAVGVAAGVGEIGRQAVVGAEFILVQPVDDDTSAGAHGVGCIILVAPDNVEFILMDAVRVDGEVDHGIGIVGILVGLRTAREGQGGQQGDEESVFAFHAAKILVFLEHRNLQPHVLI